MTWQRPQETHNGSLVPYFQASQLCQVNFSKHASRHTGGSQTAVYRDNEAGPNVTQHNGPVVCGKILTSATKWSRVELHYQGNVKNGDGNQINNITYQPPSGAAVGIDSLPAVPGQWVGNRHTGASQCGQGAQISGPFITG